MYILKSAQINKFRDQRDIKLDFDRNVNFIIGINGSGKTTVINILKDAISLNNSIRQMPAQSVEIEFQYTGKKRDVPSYTAVRIEKIDKDKRNPTIKILTRDSSSSEFKVVFDDETEKSNGNSPFGRNWAPLYRLKRHIKLFEQLDFSWFSIQRMERQNLEPWEEESTNVSNPLDARISKVSDETSKYFFEMDSAYQTLMGKFQKDYFRIMSKFYAEDDLEEMDFQYDSFKQKMSLILDSLEINSEEMETNIDRLAKVLLEEKQNYSSQKSINRVLALATVKKMNEIIVEWTNTQKKVEKNFEPKNQFIEIMNAFLNGKKVEFRANNSPTFRIKNRIHDSSVLSSGEKQLLIFMMAALNQKRSTHVFIADEPELSLHVDWQVMLVENIQTINPAAQVIFATHSPDIVGDNKGNVIDISVRD